MRITHLLLVQDTWDGKPTYRKSWAGNLLVWLDLTLGPKLKGAYNSLIIGLRGLGWYTNLYKIMDWESSGVARFDLGPLLQGHTRTAKLKKVYNSFIIGPRGLQCETNLQDIVVWESSDVRFDLWPLLHGQTMVHWLW